MPFFTKKHIASLFLFVFAFSFAMGQEADPKRFESSIVAFEQADAREMPPGNTVLFLGSSSIRMWKTLSADMEGINVVNRGFGGSQISDVLYYFDRVVKPLKPKRIVFYCGENDIQAGKTPERVFDDFKKFVAKARELQPKVRIWFICMKPSVSRWGKWDTISEGNKLIAGECEKDKRLTYVDVSKDMIGEDGKPKPDIFLEDNLHMNEKGYAVWTRIMREALGVDKPKEKSEKKAKKEKSGR